MAVMALVRGGVTVAGPRGVGVAVVARALGDGVLVGALRVGSVGVGSARAGLVVWGNRALGGASSLGSVPLNVLERVDCADLEAGVASVTVGPPDHVRRLHPIHTRVGEFPVVPMGVSRLVRSHGVHGHDVAAEEGMLAGELVVLAPAFPALETIFHPAVAVFPPALTLFSFSISVHFVLAGHFRDAPVPCCPLAFPARSLFGDFRDSRNLRMLNNDIRVAVLYPIAHSPGDIVIHPLMSVASGVVVLGDVWLGAEERHEHVNGLCKRDGAVLILSVVGGGGGSR
mmetsp:Transcript_60989/g.146823  ORF Transcript_60989/g.146823 Transcript_60989/m.146823 type:complete len:285 (+) Transcript_60989:885-1739(+)